MSKPYSGHFTGTLFASKRKIAYDIISKRIIWLDLREHPIKQKQLSNKKRKVLKEKIIKRIITKEEYKRFCWDKRINARRNLGIKNFWKQERYRIKHNIPTTRNWNSKQINDILKWKTPKFNGRALECHHMYSVSKYPHLADKGAIIYPATHLEHFEGWHGGNYKKSLPGKPIKNKKQF